MVRRREDSWGRVSAAHHSYMKLLTSLVALLVEAPRVCCGRRGIISGGAKGGRRPSESLMAPLAVRFAARRTGLWELGGSVGASDAMLLGWGRMGASNGVGRRSFTSSVRVAALSEMPTPSRSAAVARWAGVGSDSIALTGIKRTGAYDRVDNCRD